MRCYRYLVRPLAAGPEYLTSRPKETKTDTAKPLRAGHVGRPGAWTTCNICTRNGDIVLGRTPCLISNMDSIFAVLMMPSHMRDGACQRAMIGPAIGTWLRHVAI